jgi:hypothetical protein
MEKFGFVSGSKIKLGGIAAGTLANNGNSWLNTGGGQISGPEFGWT